MAGLVRYRYVINHDPFSTIVLPAPEEIPHWDIRLVRALVADGDLELARRLLGRLRDHGFPSKRGTSVIVEYRLDEAATAEKLATPLDKLDNDPVRIASFALALQETGSSAGAREVARRAERLIAREPDFERKAQAAVLTGLVFARQNDYRRAVNICAVCPEPYQLLVFGETLNHYGSRSTAITRPSASAALR